MLSAERTLDEDERARQCMQLAVSTSLVSAMVLWITACSGGEGVECELSIAEDVW